MEIQDETYHSPGYYLRLIERRRLILAGVAGVAGLVFLIVGSVGVSNTRDVTDQLSYIGTGSVIGIFLLGVAVVAFWADQRDRELWMLHQMGSLLYAIADRIGLEEEPGAVAENPQGPDLRDLRAESLDSPEANVDPLAAVPRRQGHRPNP